MLLTISTTHRPASDLGYLLHKHPGRFQSFDLSFGKAHVYYPEVGTERCTACLMLDVDAVGMVRGKNPDQGFLLGQYVNDRPYAASSFMSVAIAQVFGSALQGRCKDRPELAAAPIPLEARLVPRPLQKAFPGPLVAPPAEATMRVLPVAAIRRRLPPRSAGAQAPENGVDEPTLALRPAAPSSFAPGEMRGQHLPSLIRDSVAMASRLRGEAPRSGSTRASYHRKRLVTTLSRSRQSCR